MTQDSTTFEILEVPQVPADLPRERWADWEWTWAYQGLADNDRAETLQTWGNTDLAESLEEFLASVVETPYDRVVRHIAVRPGGRTPADVLGSCSVWIPTQDGDGTDCWLGMLVRSDVRGQGIGTALFDVTEGVLAREGLTTVRVGNYESPEPAAGPGVVTAPTGEGRISTTTPGARFVQQRGFVLGQVDRISRLDVPADLTDVRRLHDDAAAAAGPDYRLHLWDRTVPEEHLDGIAALVSRMSTDAPSGEIDAVEEVWDAERYRHVCEEIATAGKRLLVVAAEHVPTGTLAAFTELVVHGDGTSTADQENTLVLSEHRGRRLGMLVKTANLLHLADLCPGVRRIYTWNAQENAHMLAINVALGFKGVGVEASWQRKA